MPIKKLISTGNSCLEDREDITSAPLWHIGKVAVLESQESFNLLQNTIDYLTCKGKSSRTFTDNEKEFMKELFEALWWGGKYHGFDEAAKLANHYVNGKGKILTINSEVYSKSAIVSDAMLAMKGYISELHSNKKPFVELKTNNPHFLRSVHVKQLKRGSRNVNRQGYILNNGALLVEQSNQRLKNADHRFYLGVNTKKTSGGFVSRWKVESLYDFEHFSKGHITDIPLAKGFVLKLPDGLSQYLTDISVAKVFTYTSQWQENWK